MLPPIPDNEPDRLAALRRFELLDTPPEPAFDQITRLAVKLLKVPVALVSLIDENRQWFKSQVGIAKRETPRDIAFCAHAIGADDLFVVGDAAADPRFANNPLVTGDHHFRFYAGAPLRTADGLALGTVCVFDTEPRPALSPAEAETLRDLSAMVMAQIEARQAVGYQSPVTDLANRFRFIKDLDSFLADPDGEGHEIAVLVIDAAASHDYAELNRTLGQHYADAFEVAAARRIEQHLPLRTKLYHIAAARFCCVLPVAAGAVEPIADGLAAVLRQPIRCQDIPLTTAGGVGIAVHPGDGAGSVELLRAATSAVHDAVGSPRGWCRYSVAHDQTSRRAFRLLGDLAAAIAAEGQLAILYQPKTDLRTQRCVGAEALLRWRHPELGPVSPGEFIPLVERTALMPSLTEWVLAATLRQVAAWHADGLAIKVSINVSILDLEQDGFADRVAVLLAEHRVRPDWIDLEVTESALIRNQATVTRQLALIRQLGIEIEIDDFGTGQSALSYLKYIPADVVKIDQLFVRALDHDPKDQCLVRSTIQLAHELGHRVVAEGVETMAVHDWLRDQGCDIGQGYAIARPLDAASFRAWLQAGGVSADRR